MRSGSASKGRHRPAKPAPSAARDPLPVGTLTFFMTDIEGSTRLWDVSSGTGKEALTRHNRLIEEQVDQNQGQVVEAGREGDAILAVFRQAADGLACALGTQLAFGREQWPPGVEIAVRIAVHTGEAELRSDHYIGKPLYRCARLMALAHGGQVLLSATTADVAADSIPEGADLLDLGLHQLKDLTRPEHVYQLLHPDLRQDFPPLRSADRIATNLPKQLTSFVGRRSELSGLSKLAGDFRLVTIHGPGGIGKSRLAMEFGSSISSRHRDGIWWVDLAPVQDDRHVPATIATALGLRSRSDSTKILISYLKDRDVVLILDNCEHMTESCAQFAQRALEQCPGLDIVATSREVLGLPGETVWRLEPLSDRDAIELFARRARLVRPAFEMDASNAKEVAWICQHVDRLPLAIELAAAKVGVLTEYEIALELSTSSDILAGGHRADLPRHQTMSASIEWSYGLLTDAEKAFFRRFSVFRGGFSRQAANAICGDSMVGDARLLIESLVRKSMLTAYRVDDRTSRYQLLDLQTAFAEKELDGSPAESETTRRKHYQYFRDGLALRSLQVSGRGLNHGVTLADEKWKRTELGNLWAAMRWAQSHTEERGITMAPDIVLVDSSDIPQSRRLLDDLLRESNVRGSPRLWALDVNGLLILYQDDVEGLMSWVKAFGKLAREEQNPEWLAEAIIADGVGHMRMGQLDAADGEYREALTLAETTSNRRLIAISQNQLGLNLVVTGDAQTGRSLLRQSVGSLVEAHEAWWLVGVLDSLALAELACGDSAAAEQRWREAISLARELGDYPIAVVCLAGMACAASARVDHVRALCLASAHRRLADQWSIKIDPFLLERLSVSEQAARNALGDKRSIETSAYGESMGLDRALDYAVNQPVATARQEGTLSRREAEVAALVAEGASNRQIAERLFLSERTVEGHVERIRTKLDIRSRAGLAAWAVAHGYAQKKQEGSETDPS